MDLDDIINFLPILLTREELRHVLISALISIIVCIACSFCNRKTNDNGTKIALQTAEATGVATTIAKVKDITNELLKTVDMIEKGVEIKECEEVVEKLLEMEKPTVVKKKMLLQTKQEDFKQPSPIQHSVKDINILLMGETGVGKSTFINAFANYIAYTTLQEASEDSLRCLIPTKFTVTDENYQNRVIEFGQSQNEAREVGASATQNAKSYTFLVENNVRVRLIDTPGIGDTRGADQDSLNFDKILRYLGEFQNVHAICVLLKPNNARITVMFEYCIKQLLSHLEKSASKNLMFIFTNSRSTFYRPGDTFPALQKILEGTQIRPPYVEIPLSKQNIFCVDNEAFRFLIASFQGIQFSPRESEDFASSWKTSAEECMRLLTYISSLTPHQIQDTISVNEARRLIIQLSQPLADIANLIQVNIEQLQRQQQQIRLFGDDMVNLKKSLYIPVTNLRVEELDQPRTVCTAVKCCEVYQVNGNTLHHYKQRCHDPCFLTNVPKEIVGSPELTGCWAMAGGQTCRICKCSYLEHMHIYYQSTTYEDNIVDENINKELSTKEKAKKKAEEVIKEIETRRQEYSREQDIITKSCAKFAHFLQKNALTAYNDSYKQYLEYLIDREKSMGESANKNIIDHYQNMIQQYVEEKKALDDALNILKQGNQVVTSFVSTKDIMEAVQQLYVLPHCGAKIKELFDKQNRAKKHECVTEQEVVVQRYKRKRVETIPEKVEKPIKNNKKKRSKTFSGVLWSLYDSLYG